MWKVIGGSLIAVGFVLGAAAPAFAHDCVNLSKNPEVEVQIGSEIRRMRARDATPEERSIYWPRAVAHYHDFASYQSWTDRLIPVVVLEPRS